MIKVGILTGGGDCPGLNAVIRAVVRRAQSFDMEVLGSRNGWLGLLQGDVEPLTSFSVMGILTKGRAGPSWARRARTRCAPRRTGSAS
jgi:6-phosphofructokinase 1